MFKIFKFFCKGCLETINEMQTLKAELEKEKNRSKEFEQKVKIYEELILKFNLFERKP